MNRGVILMAALAMTLGGCNMMSGVGQDLQALGGAMSDTASDLQGGSKTGDAPACAPDAHGRTPTGPECQPPLTDDPPPLRQPE
ncbi:MAG: entericidin A/B family lipoprotein [Hyphomonadaceae bacterium]